MVTGVWRDGDCSFPGNQEVHSDRRGPGTRYVFHTSDLISPSKHHIPIMPSSHDPIKGLIH